MHVRDFFPFPENVLYLLCFRLLALPLALVLLLHAINFVWTAKSQPIDRTHFDRTYICISSCLSCHMPCAMSISYGMYTPGLVVVYEFCIASERWICFLPFEFRANIHIEQWTRACRPINCVCICKYMRTPSSSPLRLSSLCEAFIVRIQHWREKAISKYECKLIVDFIDWYCFRSKHYVDGTDTFPVFHKPTKIHTHSISWLQSKMERQMKQCDNKM